MIKIPLQNLGRYGVVADTLNAALPVGTWKDARNMRFSGLQIEKMLEPVLEVANQEEDTTSIAGAEWFQGWADGISTYIVLATDTKLWFLRRADEDDVGHFIDVTRSSGDYTPGGNWNAFGWGDTVIFNNQVDAPQIFNPDSLEFSDLPGWGLISSADDILNGSDPSVDTNASCKILLPFRQYLVALAVTEDSQIKPNTVWWSNRTALATYQTNIEGSGPPDWDYESPASLSGKAEVGVGNGGITCGQTLNESLMIYTTNSASSMQEVGGRFVMEFRRRFQKGAAGKHAAVEFNNQNFVVSRDQIYVHDGNTVRLLAKDRVEEEFFTRLGKSGRYGGSAEIDWDRVQVVKNPDRKEIYVIYDEVEAEPVDPIPEEGDPVNAQPNLLVYDHNNAWGNNWIGYHNGYGVLSFSEDGQQGLFNHYGRTYNLYTDDGGQSWGVSNGIEVGTGTRSLIQFWHDPDLDRWWAHHHNDLNAWGRLWYSDNNGLSWTYANIGESEDYNHGFVFDPNGNAFLADDNGSINPARALRYADPPGDLTQVALSTPTFPSLGAGTSFWKAWLWGEDEVLQAAAGQGSNEVSFYSHKRNMSFNTNLYDDVTGSHLRTAYRPNDLILSWRGRLTGNTWTFDILEFGHPGGVVLPTTTITFPENVMITGGITYYTDDDEVSRFYVVAVSIVDAHKAFVAYCDDNDLQTWNLLQEVTLPHVASTTDNLDNQFWTTDGETFFFAYLSPGSSGNWMNLVTLQLGTAQAQQSGEVVLQTGFESFTGGAFVSDVGPNLIGSSVQSSDAEYGSSALDTTTETTSVSTASAFPASFDPNLCTIELSHKSDNMSGGTPAGLFFYGEGSAANPRFQIQLLDTGEVVFSYIVPGTINVGITSATGVVTEGQWHKYAMVTTGREVIGFVDGVEVGRATFTPEPWTGDNLVWIGRGLFSGVATYHKGPIDSVRITANAALYLEDYTPATAAFDIPTAATPDTPTTLHQASFESDFTATVGPNFNTGGTPQITATALYGSGSLENTTLFDYLEASAFIDIDVNSCTVEMSFNASNLTTDCGLFNYGGPATTTDRWGWTVLSDGSMDVRMQVAGRNMYRIVTNTGIVSAGTTYDAALVHRRNGLWVYVTLFLDGVAVGTATFRATIWRGTQNVRVGYANFGAAEPNSDRNFQGRIDEYRLSNGARYTENYTPSVPLS